MLSLRSSTDADIPAITAIYAHHVTHGTGTFETTPLGIRHGGAARRRAGQGPALPGGGELDGRVLGFAYCQWFKPRPAYRFSAEDSIYLDPDAAGQRIGNKLLSELARQAEAAGVRKLIAVIGDSSNARSIGVHRAVGFRHVGTIESSGWKFGRWLDIVLMDKFLGEGNRTPPERLPE
nr:GNAT family N-acetyltransferase [Ramlibacter montanisoli]